MVKLSVKLILLGSIIILQGCNKPTTVKKLSFSNVDIFSLFVKSANDSKLNKEKMPDAIKRIVVSKDTDWELILDSFSEWKDYTGVNTGVNAEKTHNIGGKFDLIGNGALLLQKSQPEKPFWKVDNFKGEGIWSSKWVELPDGYSIKTLNTNILIYGQKQDMTRGWIKFSGNPLVCANGWMHATKQTLQIPDSMPAQPADQSLVRGRGKWEGKWLLLFNIGSFAYKGWGMAIAESLEPLKQGINPFRLAEPYPLYKGTGGKNAPNDWIEINGTWYLPDESRSSPYMWTSPDLINYTNHGPIKGINGHDPGICYDGERFYLFNEFENGIKYCSAKDPLGDWTPNGITFDIGSHSGDADVSFFNNRWHMFYDDNPHLHYMIGYASTTPSLFPNGWELNRKIFGPHNPEQGQLWDDDTEEGNKFGTGDADIALEGSTLYMTYEWPIGIAYKEFEVLDGSEQSIRVILEVDNNDDGKPDISTGWHVLSTGQNSWDTGSSLPSLMGKKIRITFFLETRNVKESPMITHCTIVARQ